MSEGSGKFIDRDVLAMAALQGGLGQGQRSGLDPLNWAWSAQYIAQRAYEVADAMMAQRQGGAKEAVQ
jgi:hypothetical protein